MNLAVKINTEPATIQVQLGESGCLTLADTWNNRRLLMVLLRLVGNAQGKPALTFAEIAQAFGYRDRRNVNNFWREYEQSGGDCLAYLQRQYKIDERIRTAIGEVFLEDLWQTPAAVTTEVRRRLALGAHGLSEATVRRVLGEGLKIQAQMQRMLAQGHAHVRETFLIEELFGTIEQLLDGAREPAERTTARIEHLQAAVTPAAAAAAPPPPPPASPIPADALVRELKKRDAPVAAWAQEHLWLLLLYWHGISLATLGQWVGVNKSTVGRRLGKFSAVAVLVLGLGAGACSGRLGIDEKWIRIGGAWHYLFVAVDLETERPLHFEIYKSRSSYYCRLFLVRLRQLGYQPRLIVTDGWVGYAGAIKKVFPQAQHQLCIFHIMRAITQWIKQHKGWSEAAQRDNREAKHIFQTPDKRTARRRFKKLKRRRRLKGLTRLLARKWPRIVPAIGSTWIATTNNSTERFNRAFERFYRARQAFHDRASAYVQVQLFMLGYLIDQPIGSGQSPLESVHPEITQSALYRLWNKPDFSQLRFGQARLERKAG
jgi:transposase-like protein